MAVFLPCLFSRWPTEDKAGEAVRSFNDWDDVERDVKRNLEWLLNTEQPDKLAGVKLPAAVQRSCLCFGIPAFSGHVQSAMNVKDMAWAIRERIIAFEPRLEAATLSVEPVGDGKKNNFNRLQFRIHGLLRADPMPREFLVQSELDMESGDAKIVD